MSYGIFLYHPLVKTKSLYNKLSPDEFEHPKLTPEQISYFKTRLEAYEYQKNDVVGNIAEYEKYFGKCIVTVTIYQTEIVFSIPYWQNFDRAIFEALMTAYEINDSSQFAVYDPQNGTWDEE